MTRVLGGHPIDALWSENGAPGWVFDPQAFGLPAYPLPASAIKEHPKADKIMAHLVVGSMLGHVIFIPGAGCDFWRELPKKQQLNITKLAEENEE